MNATRHWRRYALSSTEGRITLLETSNELLQKENNICEKRPNIWRPTAKKFNLRLFGLAQDVEQGNPPSFMATFFKEIFMDKNLPCEPEVETGHISNLIGSQSDHSENAKIFGQGSYFKNSEKGVMNFQGMKVRIFPDLTVEMAKRKAQFQDVSAKLHEAGIKHGIIYPDTLIIRG